MADDSARRRGPAQGRQLRCATTNFSSTELITKKRTNLASDGFVRASALLTQEALLQPARAPVSATASACCFSNYSAVDEKNFDAVVRYNRLSMRAGAPQSTRLLLCSGTPTGKAMALEQRQPIRTSQKYREKIDETLERREQATSVRTHGTTPFGDGRSSVLEEATKQKKSRTSRTDRCGAWPRRKPAQVDTVRDPHGGDGVYEIQNPRDLPSALSGGREARFSTAGAHARHDGTRVPIRWSGQLPFGEHLILATALQKQEKKGVKKKISINAPTNGNSSAQLARYVSRPVHSAAGRWVQYASVCFGATFRGRARDAR